MKTIKMLGLAAAMVAAHGAYAMQAMTDTAMSNATGQDGIDINLQNTNLSVGYLRWGTETGVSKVQDPTTTYTNAAFLQVSNVGITGGSTDIQLSMGSTAAVAATSTTPAVAAQAALRVTISANSLTFTPMVVSLNAWDGTQASLTANTDPSGGTGMFGINLGSVSIPAANLTITQGFTDQVAGAQLSADGITIYNAGCTGACVTIKGLQIYNPLDGSIVFGAKQIVVSDMGSSTVSIGSVNAATMNTIAAKDPAAQGSAGQNTGGTGTGALWISTSASTIGSVYVQGIQMGDVASTASVGDVALVNVAMGKNNIFVSALK